MIQKSIFVFLIFFLASYYEGVASSAHTNLQDPQQIKTFNSVSEKLVCQCNCLMILSVCNHENCPSGIPMRKKIESLIQNGKNEKEIVEEFIQNYGMIILSSPPLKGFNLTAWIMPFLAMILGLAAILFFLKRLRGKSHLVSKSEKIDSPMNERIEKELKEWEN